MEAADFKRASHAVWEAMARGWDDRHAYFALYVEGHGDDMAASLRIMAPDEDRAVVE